MVRRICWLGVVIVLLAACGASARPAYSARSVSELKPFLGQWTARGGGHMSIGADFLGRQTLRAGSCRDQRTANSQSCLEEFEFRLAVGPQSITGVLTAVWHSDVHGSRLSHRWVSDEPAPRVGAELGLYPVGVEGVIGQTTPNVYGPLGTVHEWCNRSATAAMVKVYC